MFGDALAVLERHEQVDWKCRLAVPAHDDGGAVLIAVARALENGERVTEHWSGQDRWKLYTYDRPSPALSAEVDPNRVLLLDVNLTNNSRTLEPAGAAAATKWSLKWMVWLQDHLLSWAFFV